VTVHSRHQQFDYVITLCDDAAETCPVFSGRAERLHWSYPDPVVFTGTEEQKQPHSMTSHDK
jgi:arsenate reductase